MSKIKRKRCPFCGCLNTIKWGCRNGHQRYKCTLCKAMFTAKNSGICKSNLCLSGSSGICFRNEKNKRKNKKWRYYVPSSCYYFFGNLPTIFGNITLKILFYFQPLIYWQFHLSSIPICSM